MFGKTLKLAAATLAVAAPTLVSAAPLSDAPVAVQSANILNLYSPASNSDLFASLQKATTTLTVTFTDNASEAASAVTFAIADGSSTKTIVDKGSFAPGATIHHTFVLDDNVANNAKVSVSEVDFADGHVWHVGDSVPQAR